MRLEIPLAFAFALSLATSGVARKAEEVTPLLVGSTVPKVSVIDESGTAQYLPSLTKEKYTLLVFYRGGWCPYCSAHMQELAAVESQFVDMGYQIIGLSPDSPKRLSSIEKEGDLNYALYSDSDLSAAKAFGIDFTLGKETLKKYRDYGIDLEKQSGGKNKDQLPVPSVFIIAPNNEIAFSYVNPDYSERIPGDLLAAAAKAISDQ